MPNKPTTLGYFVQRLRNCGYIVDRLPIDYSAVDSRVWSVVIDPGCASIICTHYTNRSEMGDNYFEFYDGGQFFPDGRKFKTESIEVVVEILVRHGVNRKSRTYDNAGPATASELSDAPRG